jgi:outer membrane protein TolC
VTAGASAQEAAGIRMATLPDLTAAALASDPRTRELTLLERQTALRLRNLEVAWLPSLSVDGSAQFQSDSATSPFSGPAGTPAFSAPRETFDASLGASQRLFDRTIAAQSALERARLADEQSKVRTAIYAVRQDVNAAFFAAAALQQRAKVLDASIGEVEARVREMQARVREGAALPADAQILEATLLERREDRDEIGASLRAALARLSTLAGRGIADGVELALPDVAAALAAARQSPQPVRLRPEYASFDSARTRAARQSDVVAAQASPRVSAFARAGYGRPGLDFISTDFQAYALGGLRVQWNAWTWGATGREREALAVQQQIADADEASFARMLAIAEQSEWPAIERLERSLATDTQIIELRQAVERSARVRLNEGVLTAADYVARDTELLQATYRRSSHEVELAQARVRLATTLGIEVK